tara:strand:+ start:729 stop:935 length:207 start_codon:yes stop_codon:yes gene_type:complete
MTKITFNEEDSMLIRDCLELALLRITDIHNTDNISEKLNNIICKMKNITKKTESGSSSVALDCENCEI